MRRKKRYAAKKVSLVRRCGARAGRLEVCSWVTAETPPISSESVSMLQNEGKNLLSKGIYAQEECSLSDGSIGCRVWSQHVRPHVHTRENASRDGPGWPGPIQPATGAFSGWVRSCHVK